MSDSPFSSHFTLRRNMARKKTTVRPPWDLITNVCIEASAANEVPTKEYIIKALAEKHDYKNKSAIESGLRLVV